jgi:hypothetical protein
MLDHLQALPPPDKLAALAFIADFINGVTPYASLKKTRQRRASWIGVTPGPHS